MSKVDCREAIRLNAAGLSRRSIARSMACSRDPVSKILNRAASKQLTWESAEKMSSQEVEELLFPERNRRGEQVEPDFEYVHKELGKRGVTLTLLHAEYCEACIADGRQPYGYTQFRTKYHAFAQQKKATMRLVHKPGEVMEVDWAGDKIQVGNADAGTEHKVSLFVACLPCSQMMYAETFVNEKTENWITANVHALEYFGGVPEVLVPDNLKTGITKHTREEIIVAPAYREMAAYYGITIIPARVAAPKDKSSVERAVGILETWIAARLRDERFLSVSDLNQAVRELVNEYNEQPFQKKGGSRRSVFEAEEKAFLKPLPENSYEVPVWKSVKIPPDYLIEADGCKYSVPYQFIGTQCRIRIRRDTVDVFCEDVVIASHRRRPPQKDPVYNPDHMPENHRHTYRYTEETCQEWAVQVGGSIESAITAILSTTGPARIKIPKCRTLMRLADRYSLERLQKACSCVLSTGLDPDVGVIETILKSNREGASFAATEPAAPITNKPCGITRGRDYYTRRRK